MNPLQFWVPLGGACLGLLCLWASLRLRRRHRLFTDLPTSKVRGVFIGLVEVKGTAESEAPFTSYLAGTRCVHYAWTIEERWSRTVTEHYTDSKGHRRSRTRRESGWKPVARGGETGAFFLNDDTGLLRVDPEGATIEPLPFFAETVSRGHPLYHGKGPLEAVGHSDHVRRFVETGIPLHAPLYVVGTARERSDIVAPEIVANTDAQEYLISTRAEEHVRSRLAGWSWFWWALGLGIACVPAMLVAFKGDVADLPPLEIALIAPAVYLATWGVCWAWMAYNSLVGLRQRVLHGASLIDVQLKRRRDLIPNLVNAIDALSSHETDVQASLAALRRQNTATPVGAGNHTDFAAVTENLNVVVEKYPQLIAQPAFSALHTELVETEQRIALARGYYNDIATQFSTRLEIIPDRWIARLGGMRPEPFLEAAGFERAPVHVHLST